MSRSTWKIPFISKTLFLKIQQESSKQLESSKYNYKPFLISSRASTISSFFIGKTVKIYTGNKYKPVKITKRHLGFKFGEFALTRRVGKKKVSTKKK